MTFEFRLPDIGEGIAEGEVVKWFVREGDPIAEDAPLVSVLTDKANVEIPSPKTGRVLALHAREGEKVKVGGLLVTIDTGEAGTAPNAPQGESAPPRGGGAGATAPAVSGATKGSSAASTPSTVATGPGSARVQAAPMVRRIATELGVDLASVPGSGPGGRITESDVRAFARSAGPGPSSAPSLPVDSPPSTPSSAPAPGAAPEPSLIPP
ncbi:MAG: biotin/lipoyl-containing protein, partial [Thermoplasmata archaeon]